MGTCFLLLNFFLLLFLLSWLLLWTDLLVLFFVRVTSHRLRSALASAPDSAKYICCEGPAALSFPSFVAKKCRPDVVYKCMWYLISCLGVTSKLTFLSMTDTYVHCENRSLIQCFVLMHSAVNVSVDLSFAVCCYACCVPFAWRPLLMNLEPRVTTTARRVQSTLPMHQPYHCFQLFNSCVHAYSQLTTSTYHLPGLFRGFRPLSMLVFLGKTAPSIALL